MTTNAKEAILTAARRSAQAHGYGGLNFRDLAAEVGIKAASIYHHFASKADLGAAIARRYWEDTKADLEAIQAECADPLECLRRYPQIFRRSLENGNRLCLCSFMSAEFDDLPAPMKVEAQAFADVNVDWLSQVLIRAGVVGAEAGEERARAIFAAISGAQLMARSRADIAVFDAVVQGYKSVGLLPV